MTTATGAKAPPTGRLPVGETITRALLLISDSPRSPLQIRPYEPADWPAGWALLEPVFRVCSPSPPPCGTRAGDAWEVLEQAWIAHHRGGVMPSLLLDPCNSCHLR